MGGGVDVCVGSKRVKQLPSWVGWESNRGDRGGEVDWSAGDAGDAEDNAGDTGVGGSACAGGTWRVAGVEGEGKDEDARDGVSLGEGVCVDVAGCCAWLGREGRGGREVRCGVLGEVFVISMLFLADASISGLTSNLWTVPGLKLPVCLAFGDPALKSLDELLFKCDTCRYQIK